MMLQRAFSNLSILGLVGTTMQTAHAQSERTINAIPADNHHIHAEQEIKLTPGNNAISVISNVPITVGKYSDAGTFLWGEQPGKLFHSDFSSRGVCVHSYITINNNLSTFTHASSSAPLLFVQCLKTGPKW